MRASNLAHRYQAELLTAIPGSRRRRSPVQMMERSPRRIIRLQYAEKQLLGKLLSGRDNAK